MTTRRSFLFQYGAVAAAIVAAPAAVLDSTRRVTTPVVQTVLGPLPRERMGFTQPHEHVLASSTEFDRLWPEYLGGRSKFIDLAVARLRAAKAAGIDTIVDCTTADLGRDVRLLQAVSRGSGVHIVTCTGHWLTPTPSFEARTADELAEFFTLEIERGIEDTGIRPGVIKVAAEGEALTPFHEKTFRAAARASKRTRVPVTTHSEARKRGGEAQAAVFEQEGLDPRMVCIGHSDESADFEYLAGLARRGYTLGFDHLFYGLPAMGGGTNGIPTWQDRAMMLKKLVDAALGDRIFLANDWMFGVTIAPTGTMDVLNARNPDGILFNLHKTIPHLREIGLTEQQVHEITSTNPELFLARTS